MVRRPLYGHLVDDWCMVFSQVIRVAATGSTNADVMAALDSEAWPHLAVLVADSQVAGRGRGGARWVTAPGTSLTCSVVIRPDAGGLPVTWLPLAVGLAVRRVLKPWLPTLLKWPNDLVAESPCPDPEWGWGPKVGGILCELHPSGAVIAGVGVNCLQQPSELPVPWAGSIASLVGAAPSPDELLEPLGVALSDCLTADPDSLREQYLDASAVLGQEISVTVPDSRVLVGTAVGIDDDGALLLRLDEHQTDGTGVGHVLRVTAGEARRIRGAV